MRDNFSEEYRKYRIWLDKDRTPKDFEDVTRCEDIYNIVYEWYHASERSAKELATLISGFFSESTDSTPPVSSTGGYAIED